MARSLHACARSFFRVGFGERLSCLGRASPIPHGKRRSDETCERRGAAEHKDFALRMPLASQTSRREVRENTLRCPCQRIARFFILAGGSGMLKTKLFSVLALIVL